MTTDQMRVRASFTKFYDVKLTAARSDAASNPNRSSSAGKNTNALRERHLRHLEAVLLREGVTHIGSITPDHVNTAFLECVESIIPRYDTAPLSGTIRTVAATLRTFIRFHVERGTIPQRNQHILLEGLPTPSPTKRKMLIVPGEVWPDVFAAAEKRHMTDRVLVETGYYQALRVSETISVRWRDFSLEEDTVYLNRDKQNDVLRQFLNPTYRETLLQYQEWLRDRGVAIEDHWPVVLTRVREKNGPGGIVEPTWSVKPGVGMLEVTATQGLKHALMAVGYKPEDMRLQGMHICRRSRACHLFRMGVDIRIIAKILGHANYMTTLEYIRDGLDDDEIRAAMATPDMTSNSLVPVGMSIHGSNARRTMPALPGGTAPPVGSTPDAVADAVMMLATSGKFTPDELKAIMSRVIS